MDTAKRTTAPTDVAREAKRPKLGDGRGSSKMSFAQKMMAKMGHVEGGGLGREGHGMLNPIEVKLRPQGAGVGAVKEKTPQAKLEARRAAEQRGEQYEDSSDEDRRARRRRKEASKASRSAYEASNGASKVKTKIRTAAEIEAEEGLKIPAVFKTIIDHTGPQPKMITSTTGTMVPESNLFTPAETEAAKVAKAARREVEAFATSWKDLQDRKTYVALQKQQLDEELTKAKDDELHLRELSAAVDQILGSEQNHTLITDSEEDQSQIEGKISKLQRFSHDYADDIEHYDISEVIVAVIRPLMASSLSDWQVFKDTPWILSYLKLLKPSLASQLHLDQKDLDIEEEHYVSRNSTSIYEALFFSMWLPRLRVAVTNEWNVHDPTSLLTVLAAWENVLPQSVRDIFVNQLVMQKLFDSLRSWKPGVRAIDGQQSSDPSLWLFPWLEYIDEYHLDPRNSGSLLAEIKSKYRSAFDSWNPSKDFMAELQSWREVKNLRHELNKDLELRLLPRLAQYLKREFEVDPSDQDITPIEKVLKWKPLFKPEKFSRIFLDSFFPKWHSVLHLWLTSEPNYEEVGQWFTWWQEQLPQDINSVPAVSKEWERGLQMMNKALELGPEGSKRDLSLPLVDIVTNAQPKPVADSRQSNKKVDLAEATSIKDDLEEICERDSLLMIATRKAHPQTGLPIFRITASASGLGGICVFIKGDVAYAQDKRNKDVWDPLDIYADGLLVQLAETK